MLTTNAPVGYSDKAGVYEVVNTNNGRVYIGSTSCLVKRRSDHAWRLKNNRHSNAPLQRDYNEANGQGFTFRVCQIVEANSNESRRAFTARLCKLEAKLIRQRESVYNLRTDVTTNAGLTYLPGKPRTYARKSVRKAKNKPGRVRGLRHHNATLTARQERLIRELFGRGLTKSAIARQYGINRERVARIINNPFSE